ncbi:hypothetical protein DFH29DRAFT_763462, partial [Suillus ampliporus]
QSSRTQRAHYRRHTSQPREYDQDQAGRTTRVSGGSSSYTDTNALSLHFDAALSTHDHATRGGHGPFTNTGGPEIVAPTPVVGGPNIVHMWANR